MVIEDWNLIVCNWIIKSRVTKCLKMVACPFHLYMIVAYACCKSTITLLHAQFFTSFNVKDHNIAMQVCTL